MSQKSQINFLRGWPAPELLPVEQLAAASQRVLSAADPATYTPILEYGPDAGYEPLRLGLARWLARHYRGGDDDDDDDDDGDDTAADPSRICITGGASQNLACILQRFSDVRRTRAVWAVVPVYHLAVPIFEDAGFGRGRVRAAPEDEDGVDVEELGRRMAALEEEEEEIDLGEPFKPPHPSRKLYRHLIYVVPTCANPSGKTLPLARREALVRLARQHDALVICDDVYDFLQWSVPSSPSPPSSSTPTAATTADRTPTMRLPRLSDIDLAMGRAANDPHRFGHVVSNGSFSKISGPGVRTGWIEAAPAFVAGLAAAGSTRSGGAPSQLCAAVLADLVARGEVQARVDGVLRPALRRRHARLAAAVGRWLVGPHGVVMRESSLRGAAVFGGYFLWLRLPRGVSAEVLARVAAEEENVVIGPGNMFAVKGDEDGNAAFDDHFRLSFSWLPEEDLEEGVRRLGGVLGRIKENKQQYEACATDGQDKPNLMQHFK